jgi:multiple sugar transport system permease protein
MELKIGSKQLLGITVNKIVGKVTSHLLSLVVCTFFLLPFLIMVTTAFKPESELYIYPIKLFPIAPQIQSYLDVFTLIPFFMYFRNTLIICSFAVLGSVISCPLVAYSLSRLQWKGRDVLFIVTLAVMMIPYPAVMVPIFIIFQRLGMVGTFLPLIVPAWFGAPFFIFLLRQFFKGLPKDLEDAARIDGCSEFGIYLRIFLPLCKPAILTIVIWQFLNSWNDFTGPLIYLKTWRQYTLSIGLQQFRHAQQSNWTSLMAAAFMMSLPIILMFFFLQRQFMEGMTFSGIKD